MKATLSRTCHAAALASSDVAAAGAAAVLSFVAAVLISRWFGEAAFVTWTKALGDRVPVVAPVLLVGGIWMHQRGHFSDRLPFWSEAKDLLAFAALGILAEGFLQYSIKEHVSRLWILGSWATFVPLAVMSRAWIKHCLIILGPRRVPVALFGDGDGHVRRAIEAERLLGYEIVADRPVGNPEKTPDLVRQAGARLAVVSLAGEDDTAALASARALAAARLPYAVCPRVSGLGLAAMRGFMFFGHDVLFLAERPGLGDPSARAAKRVFDIAVGGVIAAVALVPALAVAAIVAADGGNPLFGHLRIGRGGKPIRVWKIHSMVRNSDEVLAEALGADPSLREEWERDRKLKDDPRVTPVGRFIRATALDELPQLWNVLKGDMSLVGPRPIVRDEMERYGSDAEAYLCVRPGVTGLWQVSGRNDVDYATRVALDRWYVRNWSLWIDFVILAKTVPALLTRKGAY